MYSLFPVLDFPEVKFGSERSAEKEICGKLQRNSFSGQSWDLLHMGMGLLVLTVVFMAKIKYRKPGGKWPRVECLMQCDGLQLPSRRQPLLGNALGQGIRAASAGGMGGRGGWESGMGRFKGKVDGRRGWAGSWERWMGRGVWGGSWQSLTPARVH